MPQHGTPKKMDKRPIILIIDDEIDLCLLLKSYFERKSYQVYISHTLAEGLSLLQTLHPNILFLDNNLPDGLGWTQAPQIAQSYPQTAINLLSAFHPAIPSMPADASYRIYEKPISFRELDENF